MENEKIIEQLHSKLQDKSEQELIDIAFELVANCAEYAIQNNNCKMNYKARELLGNIFDDEEFEIFDEK